MTDTNSDSSSDIELDNSVTTDINDLINTCHEVQANIIEANNILSNIKDKINMSYGINIISDGVEIDFYELLESLHKEALSNIEEGKPNRFEDALLDAVDKLV